MPSKEFAFTNLGYKKRPPTSPSLPISINRSSIHDALFDTGATGIFLPQSFSKYVNPVLLANAPEEGVGGRCQ